MIIQTNKAYARKFYNNRRYVGAAVFCAVLFATAALLTSPQARRRLPAKYEHKLVGNLMSCQEDGLTRTNKALLGDVAPNGEYASYFEPQNGAKCALHSITCVMASLGRDDIPTRHDMNEASKSIGMKELMPILMDKATCSRYYGYNGDWDGKVIQKVLTDRMLVLSDTTEPGADAWIANKGGHWYAYTRTPQGQWFNVDSLWQSPKHYKKYGSEKGAQYMNGPQWLGSEAAVIKDIKRHRKKYGSNYTLYRVSLPAQQSHGAAPVKSQAKDDEECKSACPSGSDTDSVMGDDILPTPPTVETKPSTEEKLDESPWACAACTFANKPGRSHCEMCTTVRPKSVGLCIPSEQPPAPKVTSEWECPRCNKVTTHDFCGPCAGENGPYVGLFERPACGAYGKL